MKKIDYMLLKPSKKIFVKWQADKDGQVILEIENKGIWKKLRGICSVSKISLDELGSFVWIQIDGKTDVRDIGVKLENKFGEKATPLYERLVEFFKVLKSYNLIEWRVDL